MRPQLFWSISALASTWLASAQPPHEPLAQPDELRADGGPELDVPIPAWLAQTEGLNGSHTESTVNGRSDAAQRNDRGFAYDTANRTARDTAWDSAEPSSRLDNVSPSGPRKRPPSLADTPGWNSGLVNPIPVDITQVQLADALEEVARLARAAQAGSVGHHQGSQASQQVEGKGTAAGRSFDDVLQWDDYPSSSSATEHTAGLHATAAEHLHSDVRTAQAVSQLALFLSSLDDGSERVGESSTATDSSFSSYSEYSNTPSFSPLAAANTPESKWAVALKVGRDVLVLARYALKVHAEYTDFVRPSPGAGQSEPRKDPDDAPDDSRPSDDPVWSRKAIKVVDDLIAFLDFVDGRTGGQ